MYAEVKDGTVVTWPYDYDTLCKHNPSTAFPTNTDILTLYSGTDANKAGNELVYVTADPEPSFDPQTQAADQNAQPLLVDGKWTLGWTIVSLTPDQQATATTQKAASVRADRDQRLAASDWTQLPDNPLANKAAWATYRQALRDLPKETDFPWAVTWPTSP